MTRAQSRCRFQGAGPTRGKDQQPREVFGGSYGRQGAPQPVVGPRLTPTPRDEPHPRSSPLITQPLLPWLGVNSRSGSVGGPTAGVPCEEVLTVGPHVSDEGACPATNYVSALSLRKS
jgi:hypothetical protein